MSRATKKNGVRDNFLAEDTARIFRGGFTRRRGSEIKYAKWSTPQVQARSSLDSAAEPSSFYALGVPPATSKSGSDRPRFLIYHA